MLRRPCFVGVFQCARPSALCSLLLAGLLGTSLVACINKGDTNIGAKDNVKRMEPVDPDGGSGSSDDSGQSDSETDDDSASDEQSQPDTDHDVSESPPVTTDSDETAPVASGGTADDEEPVDETSETESTDETSETEPTDETDTSDEPESNADAGGADTTVPAEVNCEGEDIPLSVSAGYDSTCGIAPNGTVKCWGSNTYGQLGSSTATFSKIPAAVPGLCARQIELGNWHACAIDLDGTVVCWGYNEQRQLGTGSRVNSSRPSPVDITGATQLAAGYAHTCALIEDGSVKCWGSNGFGELGNGDPMESFAEPQDVLGLDDVTVVQLTAGNGFTCALLDTGNVRCWGFNGYGQLGNGQIQTDASLPVDVLDLESATQITAGDYQVCAHLEGDSVSCWGGDQLTTARQGPYELPGEVAGFFAASIAAGGRMTCALNADSGVACWGSNDHGQLGYTTIQMQDRTSPEPQGEVSEGALSLALGYEHGCMTFANNVKCWGRGDSGQLGNSATGDSAVPVKVQLFP